MVQKIIGQSYFYSIFFLPQKFSWNQHFFFVIITDFEWVCASHRTCGLLFTFFLYSESKDGTKIKGRKGAKNSATAAKVALMKLKLHAAGDKCLPQVFFLIIFFLIQWDVKTVFHVDLDYYLFIDVHNFFVFCCVIFLDGKNIFSGLSSQTIQRLQQTHVFLYQMECRQSGGLCSFISKP